MKRTMMIAMLSACVLALGACGDDGGEGGSNTGGTGGSTGGSSGESGMGSGGTGGSTGGSGGSTGGSGGSTGGSGGSTGGTGGMVAEPVVCGGEMCPEPMNRMLAACCVEETMCGEKIRGGFIGGDCVLPVTSHPDCEEGSFTGLGGGTQTVPSCCTPEGACGLTAPLLGFECTSIESIIEMMTPDADAGLDGGTRDGGMRPGFMFTPPEPATCTP